MLRLLEIWVEGDVDPLMVTKVVLTAQPAVPWLLCLAAVAVVWSLRLGVQKMYCDPKKVVVAAAAAEAAGLRGCVLCVPEALAAVFAW